MSYPTNDQCFETLTVESAKKEGDHWTINRSDGWTFGGCSVADVEAAGLSEVKPGDVLRFYGTGIGGIVRGVFINGRRIFYRTHAEQQAKNEEESRQYNLRRERELEESRDERDRRRDALPPLLQERLRRFEEANPNWRRDYEPYELSICEDAARIAAALKTPGAVEDFRRMDWKEQQAAVPGLFDGHSGNSFGFAVRLAWHLTNQPEEVLHEHGGMCPLVGCKDYGHVAALPQEKPLK